MTAVIASCAAFGKRGPGVDPNLPVPDSFVVRFETTRGPVDVMARKSWAPIGVDHFYTLVANHYYDNAGFYRVVKNFVAQFGFSGDPKLSAAWRIRAIADEPVRHTNARGTIAYARGGPGTRSTQLFFNLVDNARLDTLNTIGFPPIAEVVSGMAAIDSLNGEYSDARTVPPSAPSGRISPSQDSIGRQGNAYLQRYFPKLDYVKTARITREWRGVP